MYMIYTWVLGVSGNPASHMLSWLAAMARPDLSQAGHHGRPFKKAREAAMKSSRNGEISPIWG